MTTTKLFYKEINSLKYYPSTEIFKLNGVFVETLRPEDYDPIIHDQLVELFPTEEKIVLRLNLAFFHLFWDTFSSLLYLQKIYPEHKYIFICENATIEEFSTHKHVIFFLQILQKLKINYHIHSQNEYGYFKSKGCYMINADAGIIWADASCIPGVKDRIDDVLNIKNIEPFRKCYLSRVKHDKKTGSSPRVENEKEIEKFFKRNGFDIIYPEDFLTMEDQINYFNEVKTLVGVSGSALTNLIFMQPNTKIIELTVPLETTNQPFRGGDPNTLLTQSAQHHFYQAIAFLKNQLHISIPLNYFNNYILNKKIFISKRKLKKYNLDLLFFGS